MADDVVVTALFLEAWQKLSPEQRASSPIGVGYGMGFEAYKEYVHSPPWPEAKNMEFHRLFIAPIAIYRGSGTSRRVHECHIGTKSRLDRSTSDAARLHSETE
jgi:hypothetical protein